ncbi:XRE family transcriptional regulator [Rhizobium deserti]|uniref:XRE family transcriptional regulator n=2 Tax=Rhizobium deserti TaxID=2547961 RepID=A0A4R5U6Q6_9HYPH|nr:XRE family transcriptional regulator [Rhizobium deserti]
MQSQTSRPLSFGENLRRARLAKGYSHEQLAIVTGLTEAELRQIEEGAENPRQPERFRNLLDCAGRQRH